MTYHRPLVLFAAVAAMLSPGSASMGAAPAKSAPKQIAVPKPTVVAKADVSAPSSPAPADPVAPAADGYSGILLDARALPSILRSPAPAIYGPGPDTPLLYPDRSHVPTPDEVQDESIVRYYHTEAEAEAGVAGAHPLILPAQAVLGPAKDALQLSAGDMTRLLDLEKTLHFTRTWKVGFLIPAGQ